MKKKLCIIALSFLVICSLFAMNAMVGEAWTLDIATIGQKADVNTSIIGTDPNGPIVYPYPPNNPPDFSAIIKIKGTGDDRNKEDYRAPGSAQEVWELEVTVAGPNPLGGSADIDANDFWPVLSWDPNGILGASQGMDLYLGDANGTFLLDMRTANSYQTVETDAEEVVESWDYALFSFTVVFDSVPWCLDADGDGYGDAANSVYEPLSGYVLDCSDCDDSDPNTYPGAAEICDGQDNNCDSSVPVNEVDDDGDSYSECEGDCNDADNTVYPGAPELCDEKDNDCNGTIDDPNALSYSTYYQDADTDGYGNAGVSQIACAQPAGYVLDATDCNDGDADTHPGATELCDGEDNNCDGTVPADEVDADLDGYLACNECDDTDAARFPGNPEVCDGKDNNCDGTTPVDEVDADLDGYLACNECDDTDAVRFPGNPEVCDGKDNDCDGTVPADEVDADSDGYLACNECDDTDAAINPGAAELCDGIDNDCSGVIDDPNALVYNDYYRDADEDGYGDLNDTQNDCVQPAGYVLDSTDCNDADPNINPAATEVCDGIDNDCNGTVDDPSVLTYEDYYLDADEDGYGDLNNSQNACSQPDGYVLDSTDCDDTDAAINPGAEEVYDGIDNNCDGKTDENCYFVENLIATGQEVTGQPQTVSVDFGLDWDLAGILADPNNWADNVVRLQLIDEFAVNADPNNILDTDLLISDIRSPSGLTEIAWYVMVEIGDAVDTNQPGYYPVLSWDPNSLGCTEVDGNSYVYQIRRGLGDSGTVLVDDMADTNSYQTVAADGDPVQYLTILWTQAPPPPPSPPPKKVGNIFPWPGVYPGALGWGGVPFSAGFPGGLPYPMTSGYAPGLSIPSFPGTYPGFTYPGSLTPWTSYAWTSYVPRFPVTFPTMGIFSPLGQYGWPINYWTGYPRPYSYQTGWFYTYR